MIRAGPRWRPPTSAKPVSRQRVRTREAVKKQLSPYSDGKSCPSMDQIGIKVNSNSFAAEIFQRIVAANRCSPLMSQRFKSPIQCQVRRRLAAGYVTEKKCGEHQLPATGVWFLPGAGQAQAVILAICFRLNMPAGVRPGK